jgi:site-specific DNA-methyltransferase (adenine-specific)
MQTKQTKLSEIKPNPNNPRVIKDHKFAQLVKSIQDFPEMLQIRPIVVNAEMVVLGGNMRLKACKEAGLKEVPVIFADSLTEEQQKEFIIRDNISGGEWNWDQLANEWDADELSEWGLDVPVFDTEVLEAEEDDFDATPPAEPITVLGDLYEIGEHRLLCGDSTDSDQVAKLMNGSKADMVFTDPPYGISYDSKDSKHEIILNDDTFLLEWMPQVLEHSKGFIFMWTSYQVVGKWIELTKDYFGDITNMIIWHKGGGGLGDLYKRFATDFEIALVWNRGETLKGKRIGSVWQISKDNTSSYQHPTQKPIELMSEGLSNCSLVGNIIMDLFLGSGSTMVASHQLKRKCYGMELDPKYCDVIVKRMIKLDPTLIIKRNGVVTNDFE